MASYPSAVKDIGKLPGHGMRCHAVLVPDWSLSLKDAVQMSSLPVPVCKFAYATMFKDAADTCIELLSLPIAVVLKRCLTKCWTLASLQDEYGHSPLSHITLQN